MGARSFWYRSLLLEPFYVIHPDELSLLLALLMIFIASQIFWIGPRWLTSGSGSCLVEFAEGELPWAWFFAYLFVVAYSFPTTIAPRTHLPPRVLPVAGHRDGSGVLVVVCGIDAGLFCSDRFRLA